MAEWNLWHGCHKLSAGCQNCYVYRSDSKYNRDSTHVHKTKNFDLPLRKDRRGNYKIKSKETLYTCFTSDFFVEEADEWRKEVWDMIKIRSDVFFFMITKRIDRFMDCIPDDWGDGYDNVMICCTVENQDRADYRLPIYLKAPIKHKQIVCEPLLEKINLSKYLDKSCELLLAGGESGPEARICEYEWILDLREQAIAKDVPFFFKQTGARLKKDGKLYHVPRKFQHAQARKANINYKREHLMF